MEVKDILRNLREKNHLTQEQMAERIGVTRQAVSRWETGMTQPNPELLKVLSREFGVSVVRSTAVSMKNIANGAMLMASSHTVARNPCWTFWSITCRIRGTNRKVSGGHYMTPTCPS